MSEITRLGGVAVAPRGASGGPKRTLSVGVMHQRVIGAVFAFTVSYSQLRDWVDVNQIAALVFGVTPNEVTRVQRDKVTATLGQLRDMGLIEYQAGRGRPTLEEGGPRALIGLIIPEEMHPLTDGVFPGDKHPNTTRKTTSFGNKHHQSGPKTPPIAPPGNSPSVEGSVEVPVHVASGEKPPPIKYAKKCALCGDERASLMNTPKGALCRSCRTKLENEDAVAMSKSKTS